MFEKAFEEPLIFPKDKEELFMLTVWIPADPATLENGCLKFVKGSLLKGIQWMRLGGDIGFHAVNYYPDYEVDPDSVLYAPSPGKFSYSPSALSMAPIPTSPTATGSPSISA